MSSLTRGLTDTKSDTYEKRLDYINRRKRIKKLYTGSIGLKTIRKDGMKKVDRV